MDSSKNIRTKIVDLPKGKLRTPTQKRLLFLMKVSLFSIIPFAIWFGSIDKPTSLQSMLYIIPWAASFCFCVAYFVFND